jgi:hypothetical protein
MIWFTRFTALILSVIITADAAGFFWNSSARKTTSDNSDEKSKGNVGGSNSASSFYNGDQQDNKMPSVTDYDDSHLYISEEDLNTAGKGSNGYFSGSSFGRDGAGRDKLGSQKRDQKRRDIDADEDYNYNNRDSKKSRNRSQRSQKGVDRDGDSMIYGNGELGLDLNHFEGGFQKFIKRLPKVNLQLDPVINFKLKQKISHFGACITLGMDYLSELAQWRAYCAVEDTIVGGRFSLRGSELGMPYWLSLCVLRRTCRQNRLYETLFHTVIILSKHHHHQVYIRI